MNRRNFLAFIPAVGAIPFVATDVIQTPEKIEIIKPEPIKGYTSMPEATNGLEMFLFKDGQFVARGYVNEAHIRIDRQMRTEITASYYGHNIDIQKYWS